jgi:homoserine kinase
LTEFLDGPARVRVPATSANLGPGFDVFGLALSRFDDVEAEITASGCDVSFTGEGVLDLPSDETHLIVRSMRATFDVLGAQPPGLRVRAVNRIPHGRGLGSSAAAIVAGVQLARGLVQDGTSILGAEDTLALASELEGHPDNVAACLLGGFTLAWLQDTRAHAVSFRPDGIWPVVFIPAGHSSTKVARAVLPSAVPHSDAAFNAARAAMLILALTGRPELLLSATEDRLHQSYRASSMPASTTLLERLRAAGIAAVISGAGSSVLALPSTQSQLAAAERLVPAGFECAGLQVAEGAHLVPAGSSR